MVDNLFFTHAALPQLVIDPFSDRVVGANHEACRILSSETDELLSIAVSNLFQHCMSDLIVFTQQAMENGRAWSDSLLFGSEKVKVEATARIDPAINEGYMFICMQCVEEVDLLRSSSNAQHHFSSGLNYWNKVSRVFKEFERENHLLLQAAGDGIYGVDRHGNATFVNPTAEKILGYTAGELAGKNMHEMVHHSHIDGSRYCSSDCPIFDAFKKGTVQTVEDDVFWHRSGIAIDVEYTSTPILVDGEIMGAVVVFRDVTQKKADHRRLRDALEEVEDLKNRLELENAYLQEEINSEFNHHQIIGNSKAIKGIIQQISKVGPTEATVLIHGESGTGKELIARAIHEESKRSNRSLIRVNCAAIPEELFESEFFGHVKGAFTGAVQDRAGRFQLADEGTIFLDEVGEIPLHLQSKLLRVIQEKQFERIGESKTYNVDVRIIAATNKDLASLVEQGKFREDLYFRLNVFPIISPPLRKRISDIPLLTQHFLEKTIARSGKSALKIPMSEIQKLQNYDWPGNIRELENVIERQVILSQNEIVKFDNLKPTITPALMHPQTLGTQMPILGEVMTQAELDNQEKENLVLALKKTHGRVFGERGAAEILGLKPTTLASKIKKMQIDTQLFKKSLF